MKGFVSTRADSNLRSIVQAAELQATALNPLYTYKWVVEDTSNENEQKSSADVSISSERYILGSRYTVSEDLNEIPRHHSFSERTRFQGSCDARAPHSNYCCAKLCKNDQKFDNTNRNEECFSRECNQIIVTRLDADRLAHSSQKPCTSDFFDGRENVQKGGSYRSHEHDRDDTIIKSRHKRTSFRCIDNEDVNQRAVTGAGSSEWSVEDHMRSRAIVSVKKTLEFEDVTDDDDDIQMTKLDKPNIRVVKRVAESNGVSLNENNGDSIHHPETGSVSNEPHPTEFHLETKREEIGNVIDHTHSSDSNMKCSSSNEHDTSEHDLSISLPAENVWAKRQEERESQEREKLSRMPNIMQQAIEQHFPSVSEAALIKLDKDAARRMPDSDFARAALRAKRHQGSNDVRQLNCSKELFQRRTTLCGQRFEKECDHRGQGPTKMATKDQQHLPHREGNHKDFWSRGSRRQIVSRGKCARTRGRTTALAHSQVLRRSLPNKKNVAKENFVEPSCILKISTDSHGHVGRPHYCAVGEETVITTRTKTRSDASKGAKLLPENIEDGAYHERNNNEDSSYVSSHNEETVDHRTTNRYQSKAFGDRGHPRKGRGTPYSYRSGCEDSFSQRFTRVRDSRVASTTGHALSLLSQVKGRHDFQQQHSRRKVKLDFHQRSYSEVKSISQDGSNRLRSPVVSSEGYDEWETASESSAPATRENLSDFVIGAGRTSNRCRNSCAISVTSNLANSNQGSNRSERSQSASYLGSIVVPSNGQHSHGSENALTASRMCQSPSGSYNNDNHENCPRSVSDALAGLDINNIASVVVIDDQLVDAVSVDACEEFEEVLNKRAKKQKALLQQAKLEEEKRRIKEKERHLRGQNKRVTRQNSTRKDFKKSDVEKGQKKKMEIWNGPAEQKAEIKQQHRSTVESHAIPDSLCTLITSGNMAMNETPEIHKEVPVKTVWNSAHIAEGKESIEGGPSIIPPPIARPNPRSKSAASDTPSGFHDLVRQQIVELPVSLSSSQPSRGEKYDFTFDPHLHEEQISNEKVLASLSTGASSEAGSMTDDFRLKEKLYKVKGLWSGEEKDSESNLPSNVAKVKPQPQSGVEHFHNDGKQVVTIPNGCHTIPPKSPGIAPFPSGLGGFMFSPYPVMFGDMSISRGYTSMGSLVQPLIPSSNASTTPVGQQLYQQPHSLAAAAAVNQRSLQIRSNYMDQNAIFPSNLPPSQNVTWNVPNMLDSTGSAALSGASSPQHPHTHMSSPLQAPAPNMSLLHRGHAHTTMTQNHPQSLTHGYGVGISSITVASGPMGPPPTVTATTTLGPLAPIPPPELMNIPPPIGSQRVAPVTIQYAGFPPAPPLTHAIHPSHDFSQPPPSVRFAHPPPNQHSQWDKCLTRTFAGSRQQFAIFPTGGVHQ
ncbi:hypothetical protein RB195_022887 [Necator americanus]|uniref:Uncharacterized protein n=1 Tax=Necator americanus TaxID=51031 RepID=A0ABR1EHL1_NECAM